MRDSPDEADGREYFATGVLGVRFAELCQAVDRCDLVRVQEQDRQQRADPLQEGDRLVTVAYLEWPEETELHGREIVT